MKKYYVYMLRCFDGSFYVGVTNDVVRRFEQHCSGTNPRSYTFNRRPLLLVYAEEFQRVDEAIAAEKKLKNWTHHKKRAISERDWPLLRNLAARRVSLCHSEGRRAGARRGTSHDRGDPGI